MAALCFVQIGGGSYFVPTAAVLADAQSGLDVRLPLDSGSVRFAVIGDSGTGGVPQYDVSRLMEAYRKIVDFKFVIMLGDNIYGGHRASDFQRKFEEPYKPLLDAGVKFYAALGNHDDPNTERLYKPFNMDGERYYAFKKSNAEFFVLDSTYMDPGQLNWLDQTLQKSDSKWKISYFHHPPYSDGRTHGPDLDLRAQLMPLFKRNCVNAVFSGHEHAYERLVPQESIYFFIVGNSAKLASRAFRGSSPQMAKSFDNDRGFMLVEISDEKLYFQTISRAGETIDSGALPRQAECTRAPQ